MEVLAFKSFVVQLMENVVEKVHDTWMLSPKKHGNHFQPKNMEIVCKFTIRALKYRKDH